MFRGSRNLNITKKETFETSFASLIVEDYFKPTCHVYIVLVMCMCIVNWKYLHGYYLQLHCVYAVCILLSL